MSRRISLCVVMSVGWAALWAQNPAARPKASLDLVMERSEAKQWKALDPQTVLDNGDALRFRLQASFSGYLYAYYRGSGGEAEWLYPSPGSTASNRIEGGATYLIPSSTTSYTVSGKPGFDVVYWLLSPKPLSGGEKTPPRDDDRVPRTMIPRCPEDTGAKTSCLDGRAGVARSAALPDSAPPGMKARELKLSAAGETTHIEAVDDLGIFVYEFRIAHR
jgi:hypothetical protein